jgi:magnesium-protoporphyrin O-methyltransferase
MMPTLSYLERRGELENYFDRTAVDAWTKLTSDAPLGRIRKVVRAGRTEMRETLLSWLPADLTGRRILDAGCGTGALAVEMARRGADVVAIDLSPTLVDLARERATGDAAPGDVKFEVGDMLHPRLGRFDHIVSMDSLIHYTAPDMVEALVRLALRVDQSLIFTYAPSTPLLAMKHAVGRAFPRSDRAPAIEPVRTKALVSLIEDDPRLARLSAERTRRIANTFYISQALELVRI